eukprot:Plantae.Rhodophyta-Rhodochaete_pulchella.ctg6408.p1 GENE.Plantae.Rhodophyta-Rhodochaete_pulchella.ctg6408~~Plantae.Rhodophyta-Rhodochaete_pulchella.ctg6408.p1  ORF type:complete len:228 (-),score=45.63 Plantae.Rhodophyta-Rhodochaete_pulchella.ctg6408:91-774(-)
MALRTTAARLSSTISDAGAAARMFGARVAMEVTSTGGTGKEASRLSSSSAEAHARALGLYKRCLRHIPQMRKDFNILEEPGVVKMVIRDLFHKNMSVRDVKIVDMLVWKGAQELEEIVAQWKGRHHVAMYLEAFHEKEGREKAVAMARELKNKAGLLEIDEMRRAKLEEWKHRNLVPEHLDSWEQYLAWKDIEDEKFAHFAIQHGIFTAEELKANEAHAKEIGYTTA